MGENIFTMGGGGGLMTILFHAIFAATCKIKSAYLAIFNFRVVEAVSQ